MKIEIFEGDITTLAVDAIVNAANTSLLGGGGVDGAIHQAAGPELLQECRKFGRCETGEAVITSAYNLPCQYVIHTPGPVWNGGNSGEAEKLTSCYRNSLKLALKKELTAIAFSSISTGIYSFPLQAAAEIAVKTVTTWPEKFPEKVIFVCFSPEVTATYKKLVLT